MGLAVIDRTLMFAALRDRLRTSLWFVPATYMLCALALALVLVRVDRRATIQASARVLYGGGADGARALLSTIASSMLTIAGLVFSITIVALQLASSQFSPRVLRTFLRDSVTQRSLGMFLGSFVFAMTLLPEVRTSTDTTPESVPSLSVFVAFVLVQLSVLVFVRYIHHMAHSIRAVNVIARIAAETHEAIRGLYPDEGGDEPNDGVATPTAAPTSVVIHRGRAGVVTHVDADQLLDLARDNQLTIELVPSIGDFVPHGATLARVWGELDDVSAQVAECVALAEERTTEQDAVFGFRQLVDIAERALSPGINDPTTARQALDQLHDLLRAVCVRKIPAAERVGEHGQLLLILPRPSWDDYVQLAFEEIRHYGRDSVQVVRNSKRILRDLLTVASPARAQALRVQLNAFENLDAIE